MSIILLTATNVVGMQWSSLLEIIVQKYNHAEYKGYPKGCIRNTLQRISHTDCKIAEGTAAAKKQGVKFGRKPMAHPEAFAELKVLYLNHNISARGAAKKLGITHSTFLRWVKE